jgi:hypothetical protein
MMPLLEQMAKDNPQLGDKVKKAIAQINLRERK